MRKLLKYLGYGIVFVLLLMISCLLCCSFLGVYGNLTKSIPIGFYLRVSGSVKRGGYILICPPDTAIFQEAKRRDYIGTGYCSGGYGYMMKKVVAVEGDFFSVGLDGVSVNGVVLNDSQPLVRDAFGRKLPLYRIKKGILKEGEYLVISEGILESFDSRYFGTIRENQIQTVIKPLLVF